MRRVGLTGNIGSGKSLVSKVFETLGIPVYHADEASKKFLTDPSVKGRIREEFGTEVFNTSGEIDRKILGSIVFSDAARLSFLNSLLHPIVREDFRNWLSTKENVPYVIHEAAIILESGFGNEFDSVIHVSCPKEIAIQRVMKRDRLPREMILNRMTFQWEDKVKAGLSRFVILNDGKNMVLPQVLEIHRQLIQKASVNTTL